MKKDSIPVSKTQKQDQLHVIGSKNDFICTKENNTGESLAELMLTNFGQKQFATEDLSLKGDDFVTVYIYFFG